MPVNFLMLARYAPKLIALTILIGQLLYTGYWLGAEILIRSNRASYAWFSPEMVQFIQTVGPVQQISFYLAVLLTLATLILLLRRNRQYLTTYAVAVFLYKVDWIFAGLDGYSFIDMNGLISLIFESACLLLLIHLFWRDRPAVKRD
ncbi:MAG: hypothetical protein ACJAU5_000204 [Maricaulis maris]|jgi:hypothetical protein